MASDLKYFLFGVKLKPGMEEIKVEYNSVSIQLMDETYIMCEDEKAAGISIDLHCRRLSPCWPNPLYSAYYRKLLRAYDIGPVFAWEKKHVVGFLPMSVVNCGIPELPHCVHYTGGLEYGADRHMDLGMIEQSKAIPLERLHPKEIRIGCMTVNPRYQGRNLGVAMVEYMLTRAKKGGWDRIRARAMLDGEPEAFYPTLSWWKKIGFKPIGEIRSFGPSEDPIDRSRAIDLTFEL